MNEDARLIDATLAGDSAAFGRLVVKYQDRLFNTLFHIIGSAEEAEDVAQETFVQAFLKLNTFQRKSGVYTWMYRIAFNLWITRQRRKRPVASVERTREMTGDEPVDHQEGPDERMERMERAALIREAITQLSVDHRSILVLREIDGCDYDTIAGILDLPVGTVRSRLHRARLDLKQRLEDVLQEKS